MILLITASIVAISAIAIRDLISEKDTQPAAVDTDTTDNPTDEPEPEPIILPKEISFQGVVDSWASSVSGNRSVLLYDIERDEIVGSYNTEENYNTASLYKLFVVYEGYRRVQNGTWNADDVVSYTGRSTLECLDLAIRESYSPCAESLWASIGHAELDEITKTDFQITDSDISHLVSNVTDIMKIMKLFYSHPDFTDDILVSRMKDSFLNQPATTYNWRQGFPSGFAKANIYNKVGWDFNPNGNYWNIYHDTAIIEFPEDNRHFIAVVMTNRVPYQSIASLGTQIENYYYENKE